MAPCEQFLAFWSECLMLQQLFLGFWQMLTKHEMQLQTIKFTIDWLIYHFFIILSIHDE